MKQHCEQCEGYRDDCQCVEERLIAALERIAAALERAPQTSYIPYTPPAAPVGYGGYQCVNCGTWVLPGVSHACLGRVTYSTEPGPNQCTFTTVAGTRCSLEAGHKHAHFTLGA